MTGTAVCWALLRLSNYPEFKVDLNPAMVVGVALFAGTRTGRRFFQVLKYKGSWWIRKKPLEDVEG